MEVGKPTDVRGDVKAGLPAMGADNRSVDRNERRGAGGRPMTAMRNEEVSPTEKVGGTVEEERTRPSLNEEHTEEEAE